MSLDNKTVGRARLWLRERRQFEIGGVGPGGDCERRASVVNRRVLICRLYHTAEVKGVSCESRSSGGRLMPLQDEKEVLGERIEIEVIKGNVQKYILEEKRFVTALWTKTSDSRNTTIPCGCKSQSPRILIPIIDELPRRLEKLWYWSSGLG